MTDGKSKPSAAPKPPTEVSEKDKNKAKKWFEHARTVADTRNYDYAIECYINGLAVWPEAVDEGHKPLRAVAFARLGAGKKKPGLFETLKYSTSGKDPLQNMLNAERLLAKDPHNLTYMEAFLKNAFRAGCEQTCLWFGPVFLEEAVSASKPQPSKLTTIREVFDQIGDRFHQRGQLPEAVQAYELAVKALEALMRLRPDDNDLRDLLRDQSGKLTIVKGKFEAGDFRESLRDADKQKELYDRDRLVQAEQRLDQLIENARRDLQANPNEPGKVFGLVDLLLKRGREEDENEAIKILLDAYERTKVYQFKMRADDIRIRQMTRQARELLNRGDRQAAKEHIRKQLEFEIEVFRERVGQYPTDTRLKFELGKRLFQARAYDDAVPVLQQARSDPKNRTACQLLIAQCFFHKGYHEQAVDLLKEAIEQYEAAGDETSKELHYWLGRAYEASGQIEPAVKTYGQIIQWDYNYKDVRQRLENLRAQRKGTGNSPQP